MTEDRVPSRITAITLGTRDHVGMRDFYVRLGFPIGHDTPGEFASFLLGGVVLCLYPLAHLTAEAAPGAAAPSGGWNGVTLGINVATREDVDASFTAALTAGATAVAAPADRDWGGRSAYFADPEGNRWEIAFAPGLEWNDRGAVTKFGP